MKCLKWIFDGLLAVYLAALLSIIAPSFVGFQVFAVISSSMQPEIATGSAVYVKPQEFDMLKKGDIVTYRTAGGTAVTHRIVEKEELLCRFLTKGDANETADAKRIEFEQIEGKVCFALPYLGYLAILFQGSGEKLGLLLLLIWLFLMQTLLAQMTKRGKEEVDLI